MKQNSNPEPAAPRRLTMSQYRSAYGNECNIRNCDECKNHALERGIEIISGVNLTSDYLLRAARGLNLTNKQILETVNNLGEYGEAIEDEQDFLAMMAYSLVQHDDISVVKSNIATLLAELNDLMSTPPPLTIPPNS